jgi:hypothetical protein
MKTLTKKILVFFLTTCSFAAMAQDAVTSKLYGFVRTDYYADSREMYASTQDLFSFYPMYKDLNVNGVDLNALPVSGMTSINTRLGFDFSVPTTFLGANKAVAKIEGDFAGTSTYNVLLRIRQAYSQLFWSHSDLLIGQTWHPLFVLATMPQVVSLNTGALFQPFNRSPQIRYNYRFKDLQLSAAAVYQMMYSTQGPDETTYTKTVASNNMQRNSMMPDLFVGLEYKKNNWLVGLGGNYKSILPTRYITENGVVTSVNKKLLSTPAAMFYGVYTKEKLSVRAKVTYGQNLTEHSIIGGFAITPDNKYIPFNSMASYLHLNYGKAHQFGLLLGYTENMGASSILPANSNFYGFGVANANTTGKEKLIGNIYRITPTYTYLCKNWKFGVELEYTNAAWGTRSTEGQILHLDRVDNYRLYAILSYTF